MKCEQICYLLLEAAQNEDSLGRADKLESFAAKQSRVQDDSITSKLYKILQTLQEQKNEFVAQQSQSQQTIIDKINAQKDQIIEELIKSIYNLKKQNEQLRFQYRKRFKVIKNMQDKYENLISGKNKKINELDSVLKYLEGKIKHLQKKLGQCKSQFRKEISKTKPQVFSKSPQNYLSPHKISLIVSKEKFQSDPNKRCLLSRNSLEDLTMPLTSSFVSSSKRTSSRKRIGRNRSNGKYNEACLLNLVNARQSDSYSSFMGMSEHAFNQKCFETETNFEDNSRMTPVYLENYPSVSTSKYLTFDDFNDLERNEVRNGGNTERNSPRASHNVSRDRWNFLREHY